MPAEKGIFLDILPKFDMAAMGAILGNVEKLFKKSGLAIGETFGKEAQAGLADLAAAANKAASVTEDASLRMVKANHAVEISEQRLTEVRATAEAGSSRLMRA